MNIQAICDHEFHLINAVVKWRCCTHVALISHQSGITREITNGGIETVDEWFLGNSAYGLRTNLLTLITSPATPRQRNFNNRAFFEVCQIIVCTFRKNHFYYSAA